MSQTATMAPVAGNLAGFNPNGNQAPAPIFPGVPNNQGLQQQSQLAPAPAPQLHTQQPAAPAPVFNPNHAAAPTQAPMFNPGATAAIRFALLLGLVLIESLALYTLVIIFVKVV